MLGYVRLYSPRAKQTIRTILERYLGRYEILPFTDNILTCIDELVKNGVKANYKYVLIREQVEDLLRASGEDPVEVLKSKDRYNDFTEKNVNVEAITKQVREALTQEAKVINLKMKAMTEERKYSDEEREQILSYRELIDIKRKCQRYQARVELRINEFWNAFNIEVVNNAPILDQDMARIHEKRNEFKKFADRGEEMMFFINNMDDADGGAGLGYATIDSGLREMRLDPFQTINIISLTNTTVLLYFKIDTLRALSEEN